MGMVCSISFAFSSAFPNSKSSCSLLVPQRSISNVPVYCAFTPTSTNPVPRIYCWKLSNRCLPPEARDRKDGGRPSRPTKRHQPQPGSETGGGMIRRGEGLPPQAWSALHILILTIMTANMLQSVWYSSMGTGYRNSKHDKALSMLQWI